MQYLLIAVTVASAFVAIVMCAIVVRMLREERRRSDARVEALLAMADSPGERDLEEPTPAGRADVDSFARREYPEHQSARTTEVARADHADSPTAVAGVEELFAAPESSSSWGRRLGAAALGAALLVAAVLGINMITRDGYVGGEATAAESAPAAAPLELLSLTHTTGSAALTITGLVQNPSGGAALADVTAVALLFSPDGAFVGSGRASLDFARLDPGSESPFVVKVPTSKRVARYRISFRGRDGAVIAHVDRRAPRQARDASSPSTGGGPVARKQ